MASKAEKNPATVSGRVTHLVFRPDEERESEARLAELGSVDLQSARKVTAEGRASQSADRVAAAFGTLNSI